MYRFQSVTETDTDVIYLSRSDKNSEGGKLPELSYFVVLELNFVIQIVWNL